VRRKNLNKNFTAPTVVMLESAKLVEPPNRKHVRRKRLNTLHAPPTTVTKSRIDESKKRRTMSHTAD